MKILNFIKIVARASTAFIFISLLTIQSGYAVEETHSLIAKSGVLSGVVVHGASHKRIHFYSMD